MLRRLCPIALALAAALVLAPASAAQTSALRIAIPGDDGSLTPYTFESGYAFMSLVYDTLTWRDAGGRPQPWLATSVRRGGNPLTVDVRLRGNVRWQDGRPLTADDVAFTYRYMRERPHPRFTPELEDIDGVEATSDLTLRFTLRRRSLGIEDQPFADIPILPRHLWEGLPRNRLAPPGLPVGSGPYRLTRHDKDGYRFQANRDYFRGAPSVARIDVPVIRREDSIVGELRRRRLDAVPITVPPGTLRNRLAGVRFSDAVSYTGTMLLFNVAGRPFRRLAARRAVSLALDLERIAGNNASVAGGVVPAEQGMLDPRSPWTPPGTLHRFDRAAARLAFAEQGIGGFRVTAPRNDPVRLETGRRVVAALRAAGADVRLVALSPRRLDRALGRRGVRASFDAAVVGIPALASYDPAFLRAVFGDPRTATLNDGGYDSAHFGALATDTAAARTERDRRRLVARQLQLLARDLPAVPLLFGGGTIAYRPLAYNRWVEVRGTGILDKRSFLRRAGSGQAAAGDGVGPTDLLDPGGGEEGVSLVPFIVGFVVLMLAGLVWWLRSGRR